MCGESLLRLDATVCRAVCIAHKLIGEAINVHLGIAIFISDLSILL